MSNLRHPYETRHSRRTDALVTHSNDTASHPVPAMSLSIPTDVLRLIFEHATRGDLESALRLVFISHEIQRWVDFILYETVSIRKPSTATLFLRTADSRPPSFFTTHVKSLCFPFDLDLSSAAKVLAICGGVKSLACWPDPPLSTPQGLNFPSFMTSLPLKRLSGRLMKLLALEDIQPDFRQHFFPNLTHLDVYDDWECWNTWSWEGLDGLTHISLYLGSGGGPREWNETLIGQAVGRVLLQCPKLRVCIMRVTSADDVLFWEGRITSGPEMLKRVGGLDDRIVVAHGRGQDFYRDWHAHRMGITDSYMQAEATMKRRRAQSKPDK